MHLIALIMLTGDRAKYLGLIFAIAFCTFLLENQTSIFAGILRRTGSQILDVTDADIWVMDPKTEYFDQTKALKDTDVSRVRGVEGVQWAVRLFKGNPVARTPNGKFAASLCFGLDDATLTGAPRNMLLGSWERLREPDAIVIDKAGYLLLFPDEPLQIRQAVFSRRGKRARVYLATFIDQGYCFNAGEWSFPDSPLRGVYARNCVYKDVTGWESFEPTLTRAEQIDIEAIWRIASSIPEEWYEYDHAGLNRLVEMLYRRRGMIRDLIAAFRLSTREPFPNWSKN